MPILRETPDQPEVIAMLDQLDAYCGELYPAESNHLMDIASLTKSDVVFLVARDDAGKAVGCGACVNRGAYGEVKRMYVDPAQRGKGTGRKLLDAIVDEGRSQGLSSLKLETGIYQPEAISLYEKYGFTYIPPFGDYQLDPLSVFMEKAI
jgi:putative acetyltransferase